MRSRLNARQHGLSLLELLVSTSLLMIVATSVCQLFIQSSRAFADQTLRSQLTARGQVVLDRVVAEIMTGRFLSMSPAIPAGASSIRFQRIASFSGSAPVFGDPVQIDLVANPDGASCSLRIWEDRPPFGSSPGIGDLSTTVAGNIAPGGLSFSRQGAVLEVNITFRTELEGSSLPELLSLNTGIRLRNSE